MTFRRRMLSTVPPYLMPWSKGELRALPDLKVRLGVLVMTWDAVMK